MNARTDRGSILPIVLVVSIVLGLVVVAVATYVATTLRQGQVVEASANRLAAADGAMDNALEALGRKASVCSLTTLANGTPYTFPLGGPEAAINGIVPNITCQTVGGAVNAVDAFAVIITGAGGQTGDLLTITNGGASEQARKVFEGPVYLGRTPRATAPNKTMEFSATLTIKDGDLWYSNPTCPGDVVLPSRLRIAPEGYGTKCLTEDWFTLFGSRKPPVPNVASLDVRSPSAPAPNAAGCYVWPAGRYDAPPQLQNQSFNYFEPGDYYFNFPSANSTWTISNAWVLAGYPGDNGPSIPGYQNNAKLANNDCRDLLQTPGGGATFYLGGPSRIELANNSALEVSGSDHGGYNVGIQALEPSDPGNASTITGVNTSLRRNLELTDTVGGSAVLGLTR
jgi:Tfp pilus assembly protein PilX